MLYLQNLFNQANAAVHNFSENLPECSVIISDFSKISIYYLHFTNSVFYQGYFNIVFPKNGCLTWPTQALWILRNPGGENLSPHSSW